MILPLWFDLTKGEMLQNMKEEIREGTREKRQKDSPKERSLQKPESTDLPQHRTSRRPAALAKSTAKPPHFEEPYESNKSLDSESADSAGLPLLALGVFREVTWPERDLNGQDAHGVDFCAAILTGICALGANFADASFEEAQLQNAALCGANLTGANLRNANLRNANLAWSNLQGASLFAADLRGANLAWADLRNVDLREVNLNGAYYNQETKWPASFDLGSVSLYKVSCYK